MKKIVILLMAIAVLPMSAFASKISSTMASSDVSHLELLANNLNMFYLLNTSKESNKSENDLTELFVRFSESKDGNLNVNAIYSAPVPKVTKEQCNNKLQETINSTSGQNSKIAQTIPMLTVLKLSPKQAMELLSDTKVSIKIHAKENTELSISCSN